MLHWRAVSRTSDFIINEIFSSRTKNTRKEGTGWRSLKTPGNVDHILNRGAVRIAEVLGGSQESSQKGASRIPKDMSDSEGQSSPRWALCPGWRGHAMPCTGIPVNFIYSPPTHTIIMVTLAEGIFQISQTRVHSGEKTLLSPPSTLSAECLWTFSKVNAEEGTEAWNFLFCFFSLLREEAKYLERKILHVSSDF